MRVTYDCQARAAYIYVSDALVLVTRQITDQCNIDLDADGRLVGIELIDVDEPTVERICRDHATPV